MTKNSEVFQTGGEERAARESSAAATIRGIKAKPF